MSPGAFKLLFLALMGAGIPVAIAMAGASLLFVMVAGNPPPFVVIHRMIGGIDSFPLLAVPFFILAGNLMNVGGITTRIYNFSLALVGWAKGGLGHVNIIGSVIFAGMSGTAIADAAGLGTIEIKAMREHGYDAEFSVGVTAASATLGPIIPPSLPFVIYGMFANVSVGALFLAGIMPGAVMTVLMMATVAWFAHKNGWGGDIQWEWARVSKAFIELAVVIGFPLALWGLDAAGAAMCVRKNNHIQVDFFYHLLPRPLMRVMSTLVDLLRIAFFATCSGLTGLLMSKIGASRMAVVDLPMGLVYGAVLLGFVLMTWRAVGVAVANWKRGASVLEKPELAEEAQ